MCGSCFAGFNGVPWNVVSGPDAELVPGPDGLWESAGDMHCEAGQYVGGLDLAVIDRGIRTICWSCQSLDTGRSLILLYLLKHLQISMKTGI